MLDKKVMYPAIGYFSFRRVKEGKEAKELKKEGMEGKRKDRRKVGSNYLTYVEVPKWLMISKGQNNKGGLERSWQEF